MERVKQTATQLLVTASRYAPTAWEGYCTWLVTAVGVAILSAAGGDPVFFENVINYESMGF